ncbi:diguanylate cyclase [Azospirillum sp. B506]|uniref:sensor domain-containing diguanylate cyclase n=1 Tax=Azospirillum sp. B506 TaxID=137721 RepID=UPI0003492BF9|nr:diguanylate cyclase [Azospirillum sp. B506]
MKRVWAGTTLGLIVLLNGVFGGLLSAERRADVQAMADVASLATSHSAEHMDEVMDIADRTMSVVSEFMRISVRINDPETADIHRLLVHQHRITPGLRGLFVVSPDGHLAYDSRSPHPASLDLTDHDFVQHHLTGGADILFIGKPVVSRISGEWMVPVSRRVEDRFGRFVGIVTAAVDPDIFFAMLKASPLPEGMQAAIVSPAGFLFGCLPSNDCLGSSARDWPLFLHQAQNPAAIVTTTRGSILPGIVGPGAYRASPRYGIIAAANIETGEAIAGWLSRLPVFFVLDLVLCGGGAALSVILYRQVTRRRRAMQELAEANASLEKRVAERTTALQRSEARLTAFVTTARDAMLVVDGFGRIQFLNPAATALFGYADADMNGRSIDLLVPSRLNDHWDPEGFANSGSGQAGAVRELVARHRSGAEFPVELTLGVSHSEDGSIYVGVLRDIRERKLQEERLWQLANLDPLTGLLNRRAFMERGTVLLEEEWRRGGTASILMIDADHFKSINDGFGHQAGDDVLRVLAGILGTAVRGGDLIGRLGGEEFAIVLPGADGANADRIAERLLADVRQARVPVPGGLLTVTVSIGISVAGRRSTLDQLLATADRALYAAKTAGRDRRAVAA